MKIFMLCNLLFFVGCAVTNISSVKEPAHRHYGKIMVIANYDDYGLRSQVEYQIVDNLLKNGVAAVRSYDVFSPLKKYSDSAVQTIHSKMSIDAILKIGPNGYSTVTRTSYYENWYGGVTSTARNEISDVYTYATLIDLQRDEPVYKATANTALGEGAGSEAASSSFTSKICQDLFVNGYFVRTMMPN